MDMHETRLLNRLKNYQKLQKELHQCTEDIEELLLLYDFDIEAITNNYPVVHTIMQSSKRSPSKRIRSFFSK